MLSHKDSRLQLFSARREMNHVRNIDILSKYFVPILSRFPSRSRGKFLVPSRKIGTRKSREFGPSKCTMLGFGSTNCTSGLQLLSNVHPTFGCFVVQHGYTLEYVKDSTEWCVLIFLSSTIWHVIGPLCYCDTAELMGLVTCCHFVEGGFYSSTSTN